MPFDFSRYSMHVKSRLRLRKVGKLTGLQGSRLGNRGTGREAPEILNQTQRHLAILASFHNSNKNIPISEGLRRYLAFDISPTQVIDLQR